MEHYRQQLFEAAALMFLFGAIVGFLSPVYLAIDRLVLLSLFATTVPNFLLQTSIHFSSAILCLACYWNLRRGRLKLASIRGVIAAGLLAVAGTWLAGLIVLSAAVVSSLCEKH